MQYACISIHAHTTIDTPMQCMYTYKYAYAYTHLHRNSYTNKQPLYTLWRMFSF